MRTLAQLLPGQPGRIRDVLGPQRLTQRLLAIGMMPGATIRVLCLAPLGDPMAVEVNGCQVGVRKAEAATVLVNTN